MTRNAKKAPGDSNTEKLWVPIAVALIALLGVIITALVNNRAYSTIPTPIPKESFSYSVRVQIKDTRQNIPNAIVTIDVRGKAPLDEVTDANGFTRIFVDTAYVGEPSRLRVEATGFKTYTQNIDLVEAELPNEIQLESTQPIKNPPEPTVTFTPVPQATSTPSITSTPTTTSTPTPTELPADYSALHQDIIGTFDPNDPSNVQKQAKLNAGRRFKVIKEQRLGSYCQADFPPDGLIWALCPDLGEPLPTLTPTQESIDTITTEEGLTIKVLGARFDNEGRFRITVEVLNQTSRDIDLQQRFNEVYMIDNLNNQYDLASGFGFFNRNEALPDAVQSGARISGDVATDKGINRDAKTMQVVFTISEQKIYTTPRAIPIR